MRFKLLNKRFSLGIPIALSYSRTQTSFHNFNKPIYFGRQRNVTKQNVFFYMAFLVRENRTSLLSYSYLRLGFKNTLIAYLHQEGYD